MDANFNLTDLKNYFYSEAEKYFRFSFWLKILLTLVNVLIIIIISEDKVGTNWITVGIILLVSLSDYILGWYYLKNKENAEKLRLIEFNQVNLHLPLPPEDLSQLYLRMPRKFKSGAGSLIPKFNEDYFENENMRLNLLENIYITSQNFKQNLDLYIKRLALWAILLVSILLVFAILFSFGISSLSIKTAIPKIFLIIATSFFSYNIIDIGVSFQNKSKQLSDVFNKLSNSDEGGNKIMSCLIEYNLILNNSYPTSSRMYQKNQKTIKNAWDIKKYEILNRISVGKIAENIDISYKLLFNKSLNFDHSLIIGSYSNGIEVPGKSDLDILLVFNPEEFASVLPSEFYLMVYSKMKLLYGDNVKESSPSFIIQNFNDLTIEITPCFNIDEQTYQIVDKNGKWANIQPQKISTYFHEFNEKTLGTFYKIFKRINEWRYNNKFLLVQSVYIQTLLHKVMEHNKGAPEEVILLLFFEELKLLKDIAISGNPQLCIGPILVADETKSKCLQEIDKVILELKQ